MTEHEPPEGAGIPEQAVSPESPAPAAPPEPTADPPEPTADSPEPTAAESVEAAPSEQPEQPGQPGPSARPEPAAEAGEPGLDELRGPLEAILLVIDEPVAADVLAATLDVEPETAEQALRDLGAEYAAQGRGFDLREVAGGWRYYTRPEHADVVERFVRDGQEVRLTQAALETLAVVAYRQPVNRARVSAVRGVNCDGVMRTLVLRGLIEEAGHEPETGAILYRTTSYFLERMGLRDLDELPELAPFLPDDVESLEDTDHATT